VPENRTRPSSCSLPLVADVGDHCVVSDFLSCKASLPIGLTRGHAP
jgi:hypothetical protein